MFDRRLPEIAVYLIDKGLKRCEDLHHVLGAHLELGTRLANIRFLKRCDRPGSEKKSETCEFQAVDRRSLETTCSGETHATL